MATKFELIRNTLCTDVLRIKLHRCKHGLKQTINSCPWNMSSRLLINWSATQTTASYDVCHGWINNEKQILNLSSTKQTKSNKKMKNIKIYLHIIYILYIN